MKAPIIKVGNSRGIRIPKPVFEQCGFADEVEMEIHDNALVIRSPHQVRAGWTKAFKSMAQHGDETMPSEMEELGSDWDQTEWVWK